MIKSNKNYFILKKAFEDKLDALTSENETLKTKLDQVQQHNATLTGDLDTERRRIETLNVDLNELTLNNHKLESLSNELLPK